MPPYQFADQERDPVYIVRTIGRLCQMLLELRDEYLQDPTTDTMEQIERRLQEMSQLAEILREVRAEDEGEVEQAEPAV